MNSGERKGFTTRSVSVQTLLRSGHESGDQNLQAHHIVKFVELAGSWNTMNPADPGNPRLVNLLYYNALARSVRLNNTLYVNRLQAEIMIIDRKQRARRQSTRSFDS